MVDKPKPTSSLAEKELDKVEKQFEAFDNQVQQMTLDRMNTAPKQDVEQQTLMSQEDIEKSKRIYLKPFKSIGSKEKFNEDYRKYYNFSMEQVQFIAENKEIIGETCEFWTKPFAGMPAEFWKVPTNKPVWGPRHVAERLTGCKYHRLKMEIQQLVLMVMVNIMDLWLLIVQFSGSMLFLLMKENQSLWEPEASNELSI